MFARMTFNEYQKVPFEIIDKMSECLGDEIKYDQIVGYTSKDGEQKTQKYSDWQHSYNPEDPKVISGDKYLVRNVNVVELDPYKEYLIEMEGFMTLFPSIKVSVRGVVQTSTNKHMGLINDLITIQDKLQTALASFNEKIEFNSKCDVHVANLGLLHVNQLAYTKDTCTEDLQLKLNCGWRILAVCVQPDQRRPDYILGRFNTEEQNEITCINF